MSLRSDFLGQLHNDEALFKARQQIDVPPLREAELREVISRPAQLLGARFETEGLIDIITRRTAEDSIKDVGALPLLSYTLDDMWTQMVEHGDGALRLPAQAFELGGVLVDRADKFLAAHPGSEDALRRVLTLRLATVRDDGVPTRRSAARAEFSNEEWRLVSELADFPNRLLVTIATPAGETYAEVAHEAIFRRWGKLREWIAAEREFLAWRSGLEAARRAWQGLPASLRGDALLMGYALVQASNWLKRRPQDIAANDREFIVLSMRSARRQAWRRIAAIAAVVTAMIAASVGWLNEGYLRAQWRWFTVTHPFLVSEVRPYVLAAAAEQALKPKDAFRECAAADGKDYCPEMVVVPGGSFMMGSPPTETGRMPDEAADEEPREGPQHRVTIAKPFAVAKFALTFSEWDTCVAYGDCPHVSDAGWGTGQRPAINMSWDDAQRYVAWLSKMTGKPYRLLTEAEYEYATRAGTQYAFPWGDEVGLRNADCDDCGSPWDGKKTAPVGSFPPNAFGLYDMVGNLWEWVEDCYHPSYTTAPSKTQGKIDAPTDGSAWTTACWDDRLHVGRGGSWRSRHENIRSAGRNRATADRGGEDLGFRVARTLAP